MGQIYKTFGIYFEFHRENFIDLIHVVMYLIMRKGIIFLILSVLLSTICAVVYTKHFSGSGKYVYSSDQSPVYRNVQFEQGHFPDFTFAAENSVDGVVYVQVTRREQPREAAILEHFFGYGSPQAMPRESVNSGSGVIISGDGYVVTNNHVVANGQEIQVTMTNNKTFNAKLVGADPVTDVALLKIEGENLPALPFGNSDSLRLGEWVLAIGSPYNLRSTVTAGIVSAKGRSLPDASGEFKIESFIQTDAAVNPGNSGGALVNTRGEVVGINTAIASNTGSYTGYSFAVPSTIVQKVVGDIMQFGSVQRAMLGVSMMELTDKLAEQAGIKGNFSGVYVPEVQNGGAAWQAGMRDGDVMLEIDGNVVKTPSDVQAKINGYKPGDKVAIKIVRNGGEKMLDVTLQGRDLSGVVASDGNQVEIMGATLETVSVQKLKKLRIKGGVEVMSLGKGKFRDAGIREGLVITHVNQVPVREAQQVLEIAATAKRGLLIEGMYPNGQVYYYGVGV